MCLLFVRIIICKTYETFLMELQKTKFKISKNDECFRILHTNSKEKNVCI